jgi:sporulation-control protein spo0M
MFNLVMAPIFQTTHITPSIPVMWDHLGMDILLARENPITPHPMMDAINIALEALGLFITTVGIPSQAQNALIILGVAA